MFVRPKLYWDLATRMLTGEHGCPTFKHRRIWSSPAQLIELARNWPISLQNGRFRSRLPDIVPRLADLELARRFADLELARLADALELATELPETKIAQVGADF